MKAVLQSPNTFSNNVKKKTIQPLSQLVEETRKTSKVSHHLLETRSFANVKCNNVVVAEPSELHFSGFEVGKEYKKSVKLINIYPEVIQVHILPTQTKYFRTECLQKSRLAPGLSHTITVHFSPDEWRYFFDSIRIHCKGEENLLVNIHAYPVIDDLNIPSQINLFPVPLGQSSTCVIPLSCSCPVDFEFQVQCLKSHEAFSIYPLSGIIPAKGKTDLSVTFLPEQYGMAEITLQLVISQFNLKPFICTLTASCSPNLTLNHQKENKEDSKTAEDVQTEKVMYIVAPKLRTKLTPRLEKHKKKIKSDPYTQISDVDLSKHGLAKMLIQRQDKMSYKDLREAMSQTTSAYQTRQMKEAAFENQVRIYVQKANQFQWQVQLGDDLFSAEQKIQILKEQEVAASVYKMKKDMDGREMDINQVFPKLSSHRVVRCAGQIPDCTPVFDIYGSSQMEVRSRALRLFQQAVRKVILQICMNKRLLRLRDVASSTKRQVRGEKNKDMYEKKELLNLSSGKMQPFMSPIVPSTKHPEELLINTIGKVHVGLLEENVTSTIPLFKLKVPQHYKLMGYQKVTLYDSKDFFGPKTQCRQLRTGTQNELLPMVLSPDVISYNEKELQEEKRPEPDLNHMLLFSTPHNVLKPQNVHPLRIFNPAPSVYAFKPTPLYLESDPEFHLCPHTRHTICKSSTQNRFLDREDIIKGTMIWKKVPCVSLSTVSSIPAQTSSWTPRMRDPFTSLVLPLETPPSMKDLPDNIREEISFEEAEDTGVRLNPDMVHAEFVAFENSPFKTSKEDSIKDDRDTHEKPLESSLKSQTNKLGSKVLARMKYIKSLSRNSAVSHNQ